MRYENLGQTMSVMLQGDYYVETKMKSNGKETNTYTITLLLGDNDTEELWKLESGITITSQPNELFTKVLAYIEKLVNEKYFDQFIDRWVYRKNLIAIGDELKEKCYV